MTRGARDARRRVVEKQERDEISYTKETFEAFWDRWLSRRQPYLEPGTFTYLLVSSGDVQLIRVEYDIEREVRLLLQSGYPDARRIAEMRPRGKFIPVNTQSPERRVPRGDCTRTQTDLQPGPPSQGPRPAEHPRHPSSAASGTQRVRSRIVAASLAFWSGTVTSSSRVTVSSVGRR
jgi:hypothetical protein